MERIDRGRDNCSGVLIASSYFITRDIEGEKRRDDDEPPRFVQLTRMRSDVRGFSKIVNTCMDG